MADGRVAIEHDPTNDIDVEATVRGGDESRDVEAINKPDYTGESPTSELVFSRPTRNDFEVRDSGRRVEYDNGFVRDTEDDKDDITWLFENEDLDLLPREMVERWIEHMRKGAIKYGRNNWERANTMEAVQRFRRSASRHFNAWMRGLTDEDHASAVVFNVWAAEVTFNKIKNGLTDKVK